jgi:cobalt-precorrin 5A hydrolase
MVVGQAMIAAGIGCKRGAPRSDIEATIRAALAHARIDVDALDVIATIAAKKSEAGIRAAAEAFGVALIVCQSRNLSPRAAVSKHIPHA